MKQPLWMAVDLGTSFIKAGVFLPDGTEIAIEKEPVKSERPEPGQFIQKGEDLFASVCRCIRKTAEVLGNDADNIAVIGFTGQMAGFMGVDRDWNDVTGWSCSMDTRYAAYAALQRELYADDFYSVSGTSSPLFSSKYAWFCDQYPDQASRIAKYLMISGYVIGRLGEMDIADAVIDRSLLTWTGLADVQKGQWSEKICTELHISEDYLPKIVDSSEVVAHLGEHMSGVVGLKSGIPLVCGAGDKIAGCIGAGAMDPGEMLIEAASFGAVSCRVPNYRPDYSKRGFDILNGNTKGTYYAHYYMPGSGITQEWFVDQFCRKEGEPIGNAYERLDESIREIPVGSDGLFACGMFGGTVMPFCADLRGAFVGLNWMHTSAHLYRALVESFAIAMTGAVGRINSLYPEFRNRKQIGMIGGGTSSSAMVQIYSDALGVPVVTLNCKDPALWGGALLGAKGIGMVENLHDYAKDHCQIRNMFTPDPGNTRKYTGMLEEYRNNIEYLTRMCGNQRATD